MIIDIFQKSAYQAVNVALVYWNWLIGYRIAEETLNGNKRAEYGSEVIKKLSKEFVDFKIMQLLREENIEVDALTNLASSLKIPEGTRIPIIQILPT